MFNSQIDKKSPSRRAPLYTWIGLLILAVGELLLILGQEFVVNWFTPIMWTGYFLSMDGWLRKRTGSSWLTSHIKEFPFLILASVGIWVLFEAYNFHLQNWYYQNLPPSMAVRSFGYFWSFATIIPGVFISSQIIESIFSEGTSPARDLPDPGSRSIWFLVGLAMVTVPLAVPVSIARFLFGSVWIGFILLVDPINELIGAPTLRTMLENGQRTKIAALLVGGFICGLLWEAWNYQTFLKGGGHWVYTVPQELRVLGLHYGQMPILGMLGFPPFALEIYAMYHFFRRMIEGRKILGPVYW